MSDKKLLVAYRVEGDVAKLMYASNPEVAERSDIGDSVSAGKGMAVIIRDEGANDELADSLAEIIKMIKAGILKEFVVNMDNLEHAMQKAAQVTTLLTLIAELVDQEDEDVDDYAE